MEVRGEVTVALLVAGAALIGVGVAFLVVDMPRWRAAAGRRPGRRPHPRPGRTVDHTWRLRRGAAAPVLLVAGAGALVGAAIAGATHTAGGARLVAVSVAVMLIGGGLAVRTRSRRAPTPPGDYEYDYD